MARGGHLGFEVFIQNSAPLNPAPGDFWFDTSGGTTLNFRSNFGAWVAVAIPTAALNTLSDSVSVLSNAVSVISQKMSVISNATSVLSNAVSAMSVKVDALSTTVSALSLTVSAISTRLDTVSTQVSAISVKVDALSTTVSALSLTVSAISTRVDVISTQVSVLSNVVSAMSVRADVISQQVSVISVGLGGLQLKVVQGVQGVSATAGAGINISGLSVSVATAAAYQIEGMIIYQTSALPTTFGLGLNFPGMIAASGNFKGGTTISQVTSVVVGQFNEDASNSMTFSIAVSTVSTMVANIDAVFATSTAGTIQVIGRVSATTQPVNIQKGSYIRAYKII